jgi:hypothetical protein
VKHLRRLPSGDLFNIRSVDPISRAFILANAQEADRGALASWIDSVPLMGSDAPPEAPSAPNRLVVVPEHLLTIGYSPASAFGQLMAVIEAFNAEVSK